MTNFRYVDHEQVNNWLHNIVRDCTLANFRPGVIVSPSRGGLSLGVMLSHYFKVPFFALEMSTRDHADAIPPSKTMIMNTLSRASLRGQGSLLFIDDINDTGTTLGMLDDIVDNMAADDIVLGDFRTAVLLEKPSSRAEATFVGELIPEEREHEWVVFPWENWWIRA